LNQIIPPKKHRYNLRGDVDVFAALGELQAIFGIQIAQLCVKYSIDIEEEIATLLPVQDEEK